MEKQERRPPLHYVRVGRSGGSELRKSDGWGTRRDNSVSDLFRLPWSYED